MFDDETWARLAADSNAFKERAVAEAEAEAGKKPKQPKPGKAMTPERLAKLKEKEARKAKKFIQIRQFRGADDSSTLSTDSPWLELAASPRIVDVINTYLGLWTNVSYARLLGVLNYVSPAALVSLVKRNFEIDPETLSPETPEAVKYAFSDVA